MNFKVGNAPAEILSLKASGSTFAGTIDSDNITVGKSDGNNSSISLTANTGNWTFTNVQASRNLEISDSDGTGTVMTIDTLGSVGIGTDSPSSKLETKDGDIRVTTLNSFSKFKSGRASIPSSEGFNLGGILFEAYSTGTTYTSGAAIESYSDGAAWTSTSAPSYLSFQTVSSGSTSLSERMRINSSGNVSIGTVTPLYLVATSDIAQISVNRDGTGAITNTSRSAAFINLNGADGGSSIEFNTASGNNTEPSERMRIDSSGDVGIGVSDGDIFGRFYGRSVGIGGTGIAKLQINGTSYSGIDLGQNGTRYGELNASATIVQLQTLADIPLTFGTGTSATERMRIDSSGNVGINEIPAYKFDVNDEVTGAYTTSNPQFVTRIKNKTNDGQINSSFLSLQCSSDNGGANPVAGVGVVMESAGSNNASFVVTTRNSSGNTEKMRILSGGQVCIGTNSTTVSSSVVSAVFGSGSEATLKLGGHSGTHTMVQFFHTGSSVGSITSTTSATSYNTSSDYRLKEDLQDFAGLDMVSKIPVYDFKWKTDDSRSYGVMAHELQEVLPQAVSGDKDAEEMQSVDYSKIVPLLVKSIQELKAEVDKLKQECKCKN